MSREYIILNIIRVFSIATLVMAVVAAMAAMVKSFIVSKYFFFDVLNNLILIAFCIFVIFSEIGLFLEYYAKRWPLLGPESSLVSVGIAEIIIGFQLLGNLNERYASKEFIGYSFNALLIAAGIIICAMGMTVFIASYTFSNSQTHTTARTFRSTAHNASKKSGDMPPIVLGEVRVVDGPLAPRHPRHPERAHSQSTGRAPLGASIGLSDSTASRGPMGGGILRTPSAASSSDRSPYATYGVAESRAGDRSASSDTLSISHQPSETPYYTF